MRPPLTVCFTTAKVKDQQIQTEIVVTVDQDVQTGDTQGLHILISTPYVEQILIDESVLVMNM